MQRHMRVYGLHSLEYETISYSIAEGQAEGVHVNKRTGLLTLPPHSPAWQAVLAAPPASPVGRQ